MENRIFTILKWTAVIFVAVFLLSQVYTTLISPLTVETVYKYETTTGFDGRGFIVRNEKILTNETNGSLRYFVDNGGRIAKGGAIATVYSSAEDAKRIVKADELSKTISLLENIQSYNDLNAADLKLINARIKSNFIEMISDCQNGSINNAEYQNELLMAMDRKQIVTGEQTDFNGLISSLKAQRDELKASDAAAVDTLYSPSSGYFIYSTDGYEDAVNIEDLKSVNYAALEGIKQNENNGNVVGKIVSDFEWYILVPVPIEESLKIPATGTVKIKTDFATAEELKCNLVSINKDDESEMAVAVFSCSQMNTELANMRYIDLTVVYNEYSGLRINPAAVRIVDGKKGVYVYSASQAKFREINLLYTCDAYCIVEQQTSVSGGVLRLYDQIIVKGKKLYDGKYIN